MAVVNATEAYNKFLELLNRVSYRQERICIEHNGKPVAAIISFEDLHRFEALEDALDSATLRQAMTESQGFVPLEDVLASHPVSDE
jgi:prevent-host-death family protein